MKFLGIIAVLYFGVCLMLTSVASAETISAERRIVVQAEVMPAQYILVDQQGKVLEIGSNTNQDVVPQVFLNHPTAGNERPLTPEIYAQYRSFVPAGKSHPGILYKYQIIKTVTKLGKLNLSFNI